MNPSASSLPLPVVQATDRARSRMGRRRALILVAVHLLVAAHVAHYLYTGSTLSPLEPSEAGHSIRSGAINAGAIFFALLLLSTLVLGRFFCGWACHLVAYQDGARWLLLKLGIRPRPLRSRLLLFVPLFAAYWLFGKPLVDRWTAGEPAPALSWHVTSDDFWATFPGPAITILTFVVCGGLAVLVLGAKGFCTYGCPYGGLFVVADRFAKGRIRVSDACDGSAECTANCSSNVDVAGEVARYGMVVDPGCMKCMDCVAGCPNGALRYGFRDTRSRGRAAPTLRSRLRPIAWIATAPTVVALLLAVGLAIAFHASWSAGMLSGLALLGVALVVVLAEGRSPRSATRPADGPDAAASAGEELLLVGAFVVAFAAFFQLYRIVPLLLAIGLAGVAAMGALLTLRVIRRRAASLQRWALRDERRRLTRAGIAWLVVAGLAGGIIAHSTVVQWRTRAAVDAFATAQRLRASGAPGWADAAAVAERRLRGVQSVAIVHTRGLGRMMGEVRRWADAPQEAIDWYARDRERGSRNASLPGLAALAAFEAGRRDDGLAAMVDAVGDPAAPASLALRLAWELDRDGAAAERRRVLEAAHARFPADGAIAVHLATDLVRSTALPRSPARALEVARTTAAAAPRDHAELFGLLAWLLAEHGDRQAAVEAAERSAAAAERDGDAALARDMRRMADAYRTR